MKAIQLTETGPPEVLKLAEVEKPVPGPGEIVLRRNPKPLPFVIGREGVGIVEAIGAGVTEFKPGDRAGYSETPWLGGYAEYNRVPVTESVPIPDGIGDAIACAAMLQGLTAQYLTSSTYAVGPSDTVLVHAAAGGVGRLLVQFAKAKGATVIATAGGPRSARSRRRPVRITSSTTARSTSRPRSSASPAEKAHTSCTTPSEPTRSRAASPPSAAAGCS